MFFEIDCLFVCWYLVLVVFMVMFVVCVIG